MVSCLRGLSIPAGMSFVIDQELEFYASLFYLVAFLVSVVLSCQFRERLFDLLTLPALSIHKLLI
jgi:hypothetical protein